MFRKIKLGQTHGKKITHYATFDTKEDITTTVSLSESQMTKIFSLARMQLIVQAKENRSRDGDFYLSKAALKTHTRRNASYLGSVYGPIYNKLTILFGNTRR